MITNLQIHNFTLIDHLDIDLRQGFSVITGETGAGKSIILGAIGLLLGQRADSKAIKQGAQRCTVEAHFALEGYGMEPFFQENDLEYDPDDCILRREVTAAGKSRAFINDTPVPLSLMKQLGEQLVDIHSQHQNLLLRDSSFQLSVVDIIAADSKQLSAYQADYKALRTAERELAEMKDALNADRSQEDFMRFQLQELTAANLSDPDEQDTLEERLETMSHTEDIKEAFWQAESMLNADEQGVVQQLKRLSTVIDNVASNYYSDAEPLAERLSSTYIELKDIADEVSDHLSRIDFDPKEMEEINERLDTIYTLQRKHHVSTVSELMQLRDDTAQRLSLFDNSDEAISEKEQEVATLREKATASAAKLSALREKAARKVEKEMTARLLPLGMKSVRFQAQITPAPLSAHGADNIVFLFSANTSAPMRPVSEVASGGEIARVMLSLKAMISNAVSLPTIIFDEIDTGVSGKIAEAMAAIMQQMGSTKRQVISITHLPQIASRGQYHYRVMKTETPQGTRTQMTELSPEERIEEIAQMLSGTTITEAARQQAASLLNN